MNAEAGKLLDGAQGIADCYGIPLRTVQHMIEKHGMPVVRVGRRIYGRTEAIGPWFASREGQASLAAAPADGDSQGN